ncbi:MAG: hypothetical protein A3J55_01815 [Candidatus Ryanbacteria bacterium RIFCSPHIGHO2_02_FULL_45_17b]|uniref:Uncharacterized protein n=1 Tax=Candidatus Ryanbacteria bacterium RIFCSPHIGHO2_01_FULL_45_22 TaxID=1802114 RepID=A0A1G2G362_9BACT|nr:MAG: hypothetical protein A2719_04250 [Candidatus Ryanbacteria bacterium RIFCSPHIGHO2_01_FULL_45_22]OGZ47638.1 MAG: hypothetical protein A3J55_01815 [Candidatus Ryanbacteria bacterium RIFCSPHIGHO2_02_FULL_45_17b]
MIVSSDYLEETHKRARNKQYAMALFVGGGLLLVGFYFIYQLRDWILLPKLTVDVPADGALLQGPDVVVEGNATPSVRLTVNGVVAYNEENGHFHTVLLLPAGLHTIEVVAENRFGRIRSVMRQVVVEESERN